MAEIMDLMDNLYRDRAAKEKMDRVDQEDKVHKMVQDKMMDKSRMHRRRMDKDQ
jgi:hypothetical protein